MKLTKRSFVVIVISVMAAVTIVAIFAAISHQKIESIKRAFTSYSAQAVIDSYQNNKQIFKTAVDICERYGLTTPVDSWELANPEISSFHQGQMKLIKKLNRNEKKVLQNCIKLGCKQIFRNVESGYVSFSIQWNDFTSQGILCLLPTSKGTDIAAILNPEKDKQKNVTYQKLEDTVYYYFISDKPTASDPGTVTDHIMD